MLFIYFCVREWMREHEWGERQREKKTTHWSGSPMRDSIPRPWDPDLSQRQVLTDRATQAPCVVKSLILNSCYFVKFSGPSCTIVRVVHYGGKEGEKNHNGQWKLKALCIQVVHPDVVLQPQEERTSFPNMHKGIIWAGSSPAKNRCLL